jgi:hypothetical protein
MIYQGQKMYVVISSHKHEQWNWKRNQMQLIIYKMRMLVT